MDDNGLSLGGPSVDLNKVAGLNHRRSVTFMNNFLVNTSNFLNNFSAVAEEQLAKQSMEMQKLEISLNILEAKLASIPGLDEVSPQKKPSEATQPSSTSTAEAPSSEVKPDQSVDDSSTSEAPPPPEPPAENVVTVKNDPRYMKYFKMVNVGVPKPAIATKMRLEGLDPDLLDTPNAPVPDPQPMSDSESDNESNSLSSGDDFSD